MRIGCCKLNRLGIFPTFFLLAIFFCISLFISNSAYSQGSLQSYVKVRVKMCIRDSASSVFEKGVSKSDDEREKDALFKKVGQLQLENDFLKKVLGK